MWWQPLNGDQVCRRALSYSLLTKDDNGHIRWSMYYILHGWSDLWLFSRLQVFNFDQQPWPANSIAGLPSRFGNHSEVASVVLMVVLTIIFVDSSISKVSGKKWFLYGWHYILRRSHILHLDHYFSLKIILQVSQDCSQRLQMIKMAIQKGWRVDFLQWIGLIIIYQYTQRINDSSMVLISMTGTFIDTIIICSLMTRLGFQEWMINIDSGLRYRRLGPVGGIIWRYVWSFMTTTILDGPNTEMVFESIEHINPIGSSLFYGWTGGLVGFHPRSRYCDHWWLELHQSPLAPSSSSAVKQWIWNQIAIWPSFIWDRPI